MDKKRYCVHAALGSRGERLRLVRVRPELCECGHEAGADGADGADETLGALSGMAGMSGAPGASSTSGASGTLLGATPDGRAGEGNGLSVFSGEVTPHGDACILPLPGARPVVLAEGLTAPQAERLAALLSGLVDADVPRSGAASPDGAGDGGVACIVSPNGGARGIAVPEGAQRKARAGLDLLREALLAVMACNPGGLTCANMARALGFGGERRAAPDTAANPAAGPADGTPGGAELVVRGLLELLRDEGAVRPGGTR
jgi:hypothetical protein